LTSSSSSPLGNIENGGRKKKKIENTNVSIFAHAVSHLRGDLTTSYCLFFSPYFFCTIDNFTEKRGTRFDYTYYAADDRPSSVIESLAPRKGGKKDYTPPEGARKIHESIERLDREGMQTIEKRDHAEFCQYLARTKNTICGRHPIGVLLAALEHQHQQQHVEKSCRIRFVHYSQSSHVLSTLDSSVSYASAFVQQN
jgi:hypothetical protein